MTADLHGGLLPTLGTLHEQFDALLVDLDGTVYVGRHAVPGAAAVLDELAAAGTPVLYLTNNASRTAEQIAGHLTSLGIPCAPAQVVTSAQAAASLLSQELAPQSPVLVVGGDGLVQAISDVGLRPVTRADDGPRAVVQGFGPDVSWRQLAEATFAIAAGVPWTATNTDLTLPTARGLAPGNGALVQVVAGATGVRPRVAGKPFRPLLDLARRRIPASRPLVVGDRLDTDIAAAVNAGVPSLLVLTGVTDVPALLNAPPGQRPTYIAADLHGLLDRHPAPHGDTDPSGRQRFDCCGWQVRVTGTGLALAGAGDGMDALRACATAAWAAAEAGRGTLDLDSITDTLQRLLAQPVRTDDAYA